MKKNMISVLLFSCMLSISSVGMLSSKQAIEERQSPVSEKLKQEQAKTTKLRTQTGEAVQQPSLVDAPVARFGSKFGWIIGQEEPEDEWDNEVEDYIQSTP